MKHNLIVARKSKGLKAEFVAKELGIAIKSLYNYEYERNPVPSDVLIKMAELYECSIDYLLGLSNYNSITVTNKDGGVVAIISRNEIVEHEDYSVILTTD